MRPQFGRGFSATVRARILADDNIVAFTGPCMQTESGKDGKSSRPQPKRYAAFISYSHADDEIGDWLHKRLERYEVPATLVGREGPSGTIQRRLGKVFRDRVELSAAHDLGTEIRRALDQSEALIVLCSPRSSRSQYVQEEICYFKSLGRRNRIFAAILEGEPHAAGKPGHKSEDECFPTALIFQLADGGGLSSQPEPTEPIAADFRKGKDGRETGSLKLVAGILGVGLDELVQREKQAAARRTRRFAALTTVFALLTLATGGFAYRSEMQRLTSEASRLALEAQLATGADQSMLLAATAWETKPTFVSASSLFSALSRRLRLTAIFRNDQGVVSDLAFLGDHSLIGMAANAGGNVLRWNRQGRGQPPQAIVGIDTGVRSFLLIGGEKLLVRREDNVELYGLSPLGDMATSIARFEVKDTFWIAAANDGRKGYVSTRSGNVFTINLERAELVTEVRAPKTDDSGVLVAGRGSELAFANDHGLWIKDGDGWQQLVGQPPEDITVVGHTYDASRGLLVRVQGIDQNPKGKVPNQFDDGVLCWSFNTGKRFADCSGVWPIASPATLGGVDVNGIVVSSRDLRTGADVTSYWSKGTKTWAFRRLRVDPTFVTSIAVSSASDEVAIGTIDGELAIYRPTVFGPGVSLSINDADEALLVEWDQHGCRVVVRAGELLRQNGCTAADGPGKSIDLAPLALASKPERTQDGSALTAVDESGHLIVWLSDLSTRARIPPPPNRKLSKYGSLGAYWQRGDALFVRLDLEASEVWRYEMKDRKWTLFAALSFPIRAMGFDESSAMLYVGSATNGDIAGFRAPSGDLVFQGSVAGAELIGAIAPEPGGHSMYVTANAGRHQVVKVDGKTGQVVSGNLNRFPGPARVMAVSGDGSHFAMRGTGYRPGKVDSRQDSDQHTGVELWNAAQLLPYGEALRTAAFDWMAGFSPDDQNLVLVSDKPVEIVVMSLNEDSWKRAACLKASRNLSLEEQNKHQAPREAACSVR